MQKNSDQAQEADAVDTTITPADMVQIQFRKAMKRDSTLNARLLPNVSHPALPPEDTVIVEVTNRAAQVILFTNTGFTVPGHGFIRYEQIQAVAWIAFEPDRHKRMSEGKDRLELRLSNDSILPLPGLCEACTPMLRFFEWLIGKAKPQPLRGI